MEQLLLIPVSSPNQQRTHNKLPTELRRRNFVHKHWLSNWACKSTPNVYATELPLCISLLMVGQCFCETPFSWAESTVAAKRHNACNLSHVWGGREGGRHKRERKRRSSRILHFFFTTVQSDWNKNSYPTTNGGMQNGSSLLTYTLHTLLLHAWHRLVSLFGTSDRISCRNKISASELSREVIKIALSVGYMKFRVS